jgi:hypothetical protein
MGPINTQNGSESSGEITAMTQDLKAIAKSGNALVDNGSLHQITQGLSSADQGVTSP